MSQVANKQNESRDRVRLWRRVQTAAGLIADIRRHDFRAAGTFINTMFPGKSLTARLCGFVGWTLRQMFVEIPEGTPGVSFSKPVSRTPVWLEAKNPWANHPWSRDPSAKLPAEVDTVVIGAGFTGGSLAYHWAKSAPEDRVMAVLEMGDPAAGASGRNEGAVVMGRYFANVRNTVRQHLPISRPDLNDVQRETMARAFATAYVRASYHSSELIAETIRMEGFDCEYHRAGWVQAKDGDQQAALDESVHLANETGFTDWSKITPAEVLANTGMHVEHNAGFSKGCASWHPAKWVWCLFTAALKRRNVQLFAQTKVLGVEDAGEHYLVRTSRGTIRARHVVNATESYTPALHPAFRKVMRVMQTQAAVGDGGPEKMPPYVVISGPKAFWGRHHQQTLFGSDSTVLPYQLAGQNKPSRFISKFFLGHMKQLYGRYSLTVTNEWSGTVGATGDEFPIIGVFDGKRQYIIAGMVGSGSNVSFNAGRCVAGRILGEAAAADDYPPEFFAPSRALDPARHTWPKIEVS